MLNPRSPVPLYQQLADALEQQIHRGELCAGDRLPSEPELARLHRIGRPTVRQATELLVRRRLLERRRGAGTFVRPPAPGVDVFSLGGTVQSFKQGGLSLETRLLAGVDRITLPSSAGDENPFAGREAYRFVRLGELRRVPVLVEDVYLEPTVFPNLDAMPLQGASLSDLVRERYFLEPTRGVQSFHVVIPPPLARQALELGANDACLMIQRSLDFPDADRALFSELYCRTDKVTFRQQLGEFEP